MNTIHILSIDGGGIRGIIPLKILEYIELTTGKRIYELFDVIGGTSTGGIIALGLNSKQPGTQQVYTTTELLKFYTEDAGQIFQKPSTLEGGELEATVESGEIRDPGWWNPTYSSQGIEKYLKTKFGPDTKLSELESKPDVTVFGYDIHNDCPYYFNSKKARENPGDNYCVWQAARATSAAPSYFPSAKFSPTTGSPIFIDGGVYINNPSLELLIQAKNLYPNEQNFLLVSLGTGSFKVSHDYLENAGAIPWLLGNPVFGHPSGALLEVMMAGVSETTHHQLQALVSGNSKLGLEMPILNRYERYQKELRKDIAMDDISDGNIANLQELGNALVKDNIDSLNKLCDALVGKVSSAIAS